MPDSLRAELRRSFRCDCVERWDMRPLRRTLPQLHDDPGEQILAGIEKATGERPPGCPWRQLREPFVAAVIRAHRWHKTGELEARCGGSIPEALARGVETYDAALNAVQVYDARERRAKEKREREADEMNRRGASGGGGGGRLRRR